MQPGTDVLWLWPAFIYMYSISDDGVSPSLTVIHLISDDWSNCSARLSLFSLLDRLLPWWMRAWFDRVCLCVCVGVSFEILVCVYPWHRESICACSVCTLCVCVCVSVWWRSVSPVWSLCSLGSLSSDTLCSQATPLVAHWTFRETPDCKKSKRSFYWAARRRHTARSAPLKAFKLILVSLTAFLFFFFFSAHSLPAHILGFFPLSLCVFFQASDSWIPANCGLGPRTWLIGPFLPTQQVQ